MKRIAITFAGRQDRMHKQVAFMQACVAQQLFDEWHVWDFSRQDSDRLWLESLVGGEMCHVTDAHSTAYQPVKDEFERLHGVIRGGNDAHLLFALGAQVWEVVLGAHANTCSLLRGFASFQDHHEHAQPCAQSPAVLHAGDNDLALNITAGVAHVILNGQVVFHIPASNHTTFQSLHIHSGYGASMTWDFYQDTPKPIKLFKSPHKSYQGFQFLYAYYCDAWFADDVFVKLDDDIVYVDMAQLPGFLACVQQLEGSNIVSANVVNNGVCAHHQQQKGYLPQLDAIFEYPEQGVCGSLWESAEKCTALHQYFVSHFAHMHEHAQADALLTPLPQPDRFSINFVGFKAALFQYMVQGYSVSRDDEQIMTQVVPLNFAVNKYIYNSLLVAHLSFYAQEEHLDIPQIMEWYATVHP